MKILWLYRYIPTYDFDNWLHLKFVEVLKRQPGIEVLVYGPEIHKGYPSLTSLPYEPGHTAVSIRRHFAYDVVILNTKSRMFMYYDPHRQKEDGYWVPRGIEKAPCPRIVLEEDYHYERDDRWYRTAGIDLILQRHRSQSLRQDQVPMRWFPFSVDAETFKPPAVERTRLERICFAGSLNAGAYQIRQRACELLKKEGLIDVFANGARVGPAYVECLQRYAAHVSCSSTYKLTTAKMFEIMSSGSVLLTNDNEDLAHLFPEDAFCRYRTDGSDVVALAKGLLADIPRRRAIAARGRACIEARHTHAIRIQELAEIVQGLRKDTPTR